MSSDTFFGNFEDELFEEMSTRRATKREKQALYAFIGGFRHWTQLDVPLRMHVIGYLEYWDRCNLSLCSKGDNRLVNGSVLISSKDVNQKDGGMRMKPRNLAVLCKSDYEQENTQNVDIERVELGNLFLKILSSTGMIRTWKVLQNKARCIVVCNSSMEGVFAYTRILAIENGNAEEEFMKIVEKTMEKRKNCIWEMDIQVNQYLSNLPRKMSKLRKIHLDYESIKYCQSWLRSLPVRHRLDSFGVITREYPLREYQFYALDIPLVKNAKQVRFGSAVIIDGEEFLDLNATKLHIVTRRHILNEYFEEYVRRWVDSSEDDFQFCVVHSRRDHSRPRYEFTSFDYTEYNMDNPPSRHRAFFRKFNWHWRSGSFFQVSKRNDPFNSVSVVMSTDHFMMLRTGFPCIREGGQFGVEFVFPNEIYHCDRID